jgi:hypothetical protein
MAGVIALFYVRTRARILFSGTGNEEGAFFRIKKTSPRLREERFFFESFKDFEY